jgi:hypothetical protein
MARISNKLLGRVAETHMGCRTPKLQKLAQTIITLPLHEMYHGSMVLSDSEITALKIELSRIDTPNALNLQIELNHAAYA